MCPPSARLSMYLGPLHRWMSCNGLLHLSPSRKFVVGPSSWCCVGWVVLLGVCVFLGFKAQATWLLTVKSALPMQVRL